MKKIRGIEIYVNLFKIKKVSRRSFRKNKNKNFMSKNFF